MLIADGGSYRPYPVQPLPPPPPPPRMANGPHASQGPAAAPAQSVIDAMQRRLELLRQQAEAARAAAEQARQQAEQARLAAEAAEQRARLTQDAAQQDEATRLRQTATSEDLRARKAEAAASLTQAQHKEQACYVRDAEEGRGADRPSQATLAAQDDVKQKQFSAALLEPPPAGQASPLQGAGGNTDQLMKGAQDAAAPVFDAYAKGKEPTEQQLKKMDEAVGLWLEGASHEVRVAGLEAEARGEDPQAAMDKQAGLVGDRMPKSGPLGHKSVHKQLDEMLDKTVKHVKAESPGRRQVMVEAYDSRIKGEKQLGDVTQAATQADQRADQAQAHADSFGEQDSQAAVTARKNASYLRGIADDASHRVDRVKLEQKIDGADINIRLQELEVGELTAKRDELQQRIAPYMNYLPAGSEELKKLDALETQLGQALDRLTLLKNYREGEASGLELGDAQGAYDAALADWGKEKQGQPDLITVRGGRGGTSTIAPEGYDRSFWVVPKPGEENKHVHRGDDGKYYMSVAQGRGGVKLVELHPAASRLWEAYDRLEAAKGRDTAATQKLALDTEDLMGDPESRVPGRLDPSLWEGRSKEILDKLTQANDGVDAARQSLSLASQHGATPETIESLRADLGMALQAQKYAQQQANTLAAVQEWRSKDREFQLAQQPGSSHTTTLTAGDVKALRDDVRKKLDALDSDPTVLPEEMQQLRDLRTKDDELLAQAQKDVTAGWDKLQETGDRKDYDTALNERERIQLWIRDHDTQIRDIELGYLQTADEELLGRLDKQGEAQPYDANGVFSDSKDHPVNGGDSSYMIAPPSDYVKLVKGASLQEDGSFKAGEDITISADRKTWTFSDGKQITERDGKYYVSFEESVITADGGSATLRGEEHELDPVASRLWSRNAERVTLSEERTAFEEDQKVFLDKFPPPDKEPAIGADGKPAPTLDFTEDLQQRREQVVGSIDGLGKQQKALPPAGAVQSVEPQRALLQQQLDLAQAELKAVDAMQAWKSADYASKDLLGQRQAYRMGDGPLGVGRDDMDELHADAMEARTQWLGLRDRQIVGGKKQTMDEMHGLHEQWKSEHPGFTPAQERDAGTWKNLQQATSDHGDAQRLQTSGTATQAANAQQQAYVKEHLRPDQYSDNRELYKLFEANPKVMAQGLINEHYLQYGEPITMQGSTHLRNEVGFALGWPPSRQIGASAASQNARLNEDLFSSGLTQQQRDMHKATVDQIIDVGGENARVTVLPVVYALDERGGGIVKTAIFKVEGDGGTVKFVDEQGRRYNDLTDYRANNTLPVEGVNLVMAEDGNFSLDDNGNVKLFVGDARTETDWQEFRREWHVDTVVGVAGVVAGVVVTLGSAGVLSGAGAAIVVGSATTFLVGASVYGAVTSAQSLQNQAAHGVSINFITNRQARLDWLNLGASVLAIPTVGAAGRAAVLATRAAQAGRAADHAKDAGDALKAAQELGAKKAFQDGATHWGAIAKPFSLPTMGLGGAAFEEGGRYMADNWQHMSTAEKWEQGGMMLLNVVDMGTGMMIPRFTARAGAGTGATPQPAVPAGAAQQALAGGGTPPPANVGGAPPVVTPVSLSTGGPGPVPGTQRANGSGNDPAAAAAGTPSTHGPAVPIARNGEATPQPADLPIVRDTVQADGTPRSGDARPDRSNSSRGDERASTAGEARSEAPAQTERAGRRRVRQINSGQAAQAAARQQAPARATEGSGPDRPQDFSFGPEGAGLKPREQADIDNGYRFASADPLVGKLAHDIESMYPGLVAGVNVPLRHIEVEAGDVVTSNREVTDADILLRDGTIIQVKEGNANGLPGQVRRTQDGINDGAVVIGFAPESRKWGMLAQAARDGLLVTNDRQLLMDLLRPSAMRFTDPPGPGGPRAAVQEPDGAVLDVSHGDGSQVPGGTGPADRASRAGPADPAGVPARGAGEPAGVAPASLLRLGWRRTLGAVDDAFRARFGEHLDAGMPAAQDRYNLIFGKRRFFRQAAGEQLTAPNARAFARDYLAITRRGAQDADNPFAQVYHRIALTQSPGRVVETMAHELAHAYQSRGYDAIDHKGLGDVLAEGGADLVVQRLLGRPLKNDAYGAEAQLLNQAIDALGTQGEQVFLSAFFKGDTASVQSLHGALRGVHAQLPESARAALDAGRTPDPAGPSVRAQVDASSPGAGGRAPRGQVPARDGAEERFAVYEKPPEVALRPDRGVRTRHENTFNTFDEAAQAAAGAGGAWVYRISPDPERLNLVRRGQVVHTEVMGAVQVGRDGGLVPERSDLLSGSPQAVRSEVSQLAEAAVNGRVNPAREGELIQDALWIKECMPSVEGRHKGRVVVRSPQDEARASAWFRMSADERQAADARANMVLQDLVGPNWAQVVSLRRSQGAPPNILRFSDIHLHVGGRSNGYGIGNEPGPRLAQLFQRSGERRGAQVQDVMAFAVPDATTEIRYYMQQDGDFGVMKVTLVRGDNGKMTLREPGVNWPEGPAHFAPRDFLESAVSDLNDGAIEWLARPDGRGGMEQYVEVYVVPDRPLEWRGLERSEQTMREVMTLPDEVAQHVKIGLIGGQMADPLAVRNILQEMALARQLDPTGTKLHVVGGGELTGFKEGVTINHVNKMDLSQRGNGLDLQLGLYDKAGAVVVVHYDADDPSYVHAASGEKGHLLVSKTSGLRNLDPLYDTFSRYGNVKIVHAHWGGLSRSAGPSEAHANKIRGFLETHPNVYIDTSWDAAGRRIFQDPQLSRIYSKLINDFPGRFISGSDEVAQMDNYSGAVRLQQESRFAQRLDSPELLYTGNFARVTGEAQVNVQEFMRRNSGLLVPETLRQLTEPVPATLDRLVPFHDEPATAGPAVRDTAAVTGPRPPANPQDTPPAAEPGPTTERAARRSPSTGRMRYIGGVAATTLTGAAVHVLATKTGLPIGDPAITNPLAFTVRGLLIGAKTRLTGRIQHHVGKLGPDAAGNAPVLDRLERMLVKHGALIGITKGDRTQIQNAIADVRRDPTDAAALGTLKGAHGKVLSPRTAAGLADATTRHVTFGYNLGNASATLSQDGWFQPADAGYWSTVGFAGANFMLSNNNFSAMAGGLQKVAATGQAQIVKAGQAFAMSSFTLSAGAWAMHDFEPTVSGVAKSSLDLAFGLGSALQARNDIRALRGKDPVSIDKLPHPLTILAGSLVAREGFDINNYF
jgi:hypothetical protein